MKNLAIIGGGSWGTALAIVLAPRFRHVRLWVYEGDLAERMKSPRTARTRWIETLHGTSSASKSSSQYRRSCRVSSPSFRCL